MNITFGPPPEDWRPDLIGKPSLRMWLYYANGPVVLPAALLDILAKQLPDLKLRKNARQQATYVLGSPYPCFECLGIDWFANGIPIPGPETAEKASERALNNAVRREQEKASRRYAEARAALRGVGGKARVRSMLDTWMGE